MITEARFKKLEDKVEQILKEMTLIIKEKELKKEVNQLEIPTMIDFQNTIYRKLEIGRDKSTEGLSNDIYIEEKLPNGKAKDCIIFPKSSLGLIIEVLKKYAK
jgi:hypothetical protein